MNRLRGVDQQRIAAQLDLINRITRGGEVDLDLALRERFALAARVDARRRAFFIWMKNEGWPQERINSELEALDMLIKVLRQDPTKPISLGLGAALEKAGL